MGVELELYVLLALMTLGMSMFAVFEVETPRWRKVLKWSILIVGTVGLYYAVGHVAVLLPIAAVAVGGLVIAVIFWWPRDASDSGVTAQGGSREIAALAALPHA